MTDKNSSFFKSRLLLFKFTFIFCKVGLAVEKFGNYGKQVLAFSLQARYLIFHFLQSTD